MSRFTSFLNELRRRKIWLVGGVYLVSAWIVAQVASLVLPNFAAPPWVMPVLLIVLGLGLPLAIILAWAQETQGTAVSEPETARVPASDRPAIAVLPFTNMSSDEDQEFIADGMTEDVITLLSQSSQLDVTARNSVFAYKGQSPDIREVGRELNVDFVTEGSIREVGDTVRCTVQLIEVSSGNHVWAQQFDRPRDQFFKLQDEIVSEIAAKVRAAVHEDIRLDLRQRDDKSLDAWGLIARSHDLVMGAADDIERAIVLLARALEIEPENPLAHGCMGRWIANRLAWSLSDDPVRDKQQALDHMRIAQANGRHQPDVIRECGTVARFLGDPVRALEFVREEARMSPGQSSSSMGLALLLAGHLEEGLGFLEERKATMGAHFELWPGLSHALYLVGRVAEAEEAARQAITLEHFRLMGTCSLANALGSQGRLQEAKDAWHQALGLRPDLTLEILEHYNRTLWAKPEEAMALTEGLRLALADT